MDPRLFFPLVTGRDVAQEAAWRQRPPVVDPEQIDHMLVDSFLRLAGDSDGPSDDESPLLAEPERPVAGGSPNAWRWLSDHARTGAQFRPDSDGALDDGVLRLPPRTDPFGSDPSPPHLQHTPDVLLPAGTRSLVPISAPAIARPSNRSGSAEVMTGIARVGSSAGGASVREDYRSPAPGLLPVSGPSGAGSSPTTSSAAVGQSAHAHAGAGGQLSIEVTPVNGEQIRSEVIQKVVALIDGAVEQKLHQLRSELFASRAASSAMFSH